jgi:uncharacterized membrane protein
MPLNSQTSRTMRGALLRSSPGGEKHFRWRGTEISRVENLSDAVFGFSITLLVVSSQVPNTWTEMQELLRLFVPFGVCMLVLGMIWHAHYTFFRRYGMHDGTTMLLNGALLFVVVFYLYPLKFLTTMLFNFLTGRGEAVIVSRSDGDMLLAVYSAGYAGVFLLLAAFYGHAWRKREELELTAVERLVTQQAMGLLLVHVLCAILAMAGALLFDTTGLAGAVYFLIGPLSFWVGFHYGRKIDQLNAPPPSPPGAEAASAATD